MYDPRTTNGRQPAEANANGGRGVGVTGGGGGGGVRPTAPRQQPPLGEDFSQFAPQPFYSSPGYATESTGQHDPHRLPLQYLEPSSPVQQPLFPNPALHHGQQLQQQQQQQQQYAPHFVDHQHYGTPPKNTSYAPFGQQTPPPPPAMQLLQQHHQQNQQQRMHTPYLPSDETPRLAVSPVLPASLPPAIPPVPTLGAYSQSTQQPNHEAYRHGEQDVVKMLYFENQEPTHEQKHEHVYQPQSRQHFQLQQQPEAGAVQDQMFPMFQSMQGQQQHQYDLPTQQHEEQPQPPYSAHQPQVDRTFMGINMNGALSGSTPYGVGAVPGMPMLLAGMAHQLVSQSGGGGADAAAAIAPHLMQNFGVSQYFSSGQQDTANTFMRLPKNYFEVNHSYVLKKLLLLLIPFTKRSWSRKRAHEQVQFDNAADDSKHSFVPPRDDVNAPDLYIPVMSFVTYVLLVGFIFGTQDAFTAEVLAKYCSKGLGVLTLEVLIIKLGLYLINAQATPWLDVIAYRGYKFVGVIVAMVANVIKPKLYYFSFLYAAIAMFIFLLRSHRRIILPRELDHHPPADIAQRNAFLLFVCALQFPIYWILILDVRSILGS